MIPKRYLIATLFIAAMLVLLAIVQAPKSREHGGVASTETSAPLTLDSFRTLADCSIQNGWAPRFVETLDPDQPAPWPYAGGFENPWEPASPYLRDQGFAMNGPDGKGEIRLWRGLEWKRLCFDTSIVSARLDPAKGKKLLITLKRGTGYYTTRLLELPEARVMWSINSGPWSRFSWDGQSVLLGLASPTIKDAWLLSTLPAHGDLPEATLATWEEKALPRAPKQWITKPEQLWDDGKDLPGHRLLVSLKPGGHFWFPQKDRLWICEGSQWTLWALDQGSWLRLDSGQGRLAAHPPVSMARILTVKGSKDERSVSPLDRVEWTPLPADAPPWPEYDAAWTWKNEECAITPWDLRFGKAAQDFPKERQRQAIQSSFRPDWLAASSLRRSLKHWLPDGPDVGMRENLGIAWVWVGDRILMVRLSSDDRLRKIRSLIKAG